MGKPKNKTKTKTKTSSKRSSKNSEQPPTVLDKDDEEKLDVNAGMGFFWSLFSATKTHKEQQAIDDEAYESFLTKSKEEKQQIEQTVVARFREEVGKVDVTDAFVQQCCLVRHYDEDDALKLLLSFYKFRSKAKWPLHLSEADISHVKDAGMHEVLDDRDTDGRKVITMVANKLDLSMGKAEDFQKLASYCIQKATENDPWSQEHGVSLIFDLKDASFGILKKLNVADMKRGINIFKDYPVKLKKVYILNSNLIIRSTMKLVLKSTSAGLRSKVVFINSEQAAKDIFLQPATENVATCA